MANFVAKALMGVWHASFAKAALAYNLVLLLAFLVAYNAMDFAEHFESKGPVSRAGKLYFAVVTHAAVGSNDIVPKTDAARLVVSLHVWLAWMQILLVFIA